MGVCLNTVLYTIAKVLKFEIWGCQMLNYVYAEFLTTRTLEFWTFVKLFKPVHQGYGEVQALFIIQE